MKKGINVLSLFDGMSCGQIALSRTGIIVENYFASEIDKYAISITMKNFPNTKQLGSVVDVDGFSLPKIDLLIGGSPCQSFSFAGKRKGMSTTTEEKILSLDQYLYLKKEGFQFEGQSFLFWEYMRLLNEIRTKNPNVFFFLENVIMSEDWEKVLSSAIGVHPIEVNSSLVSAQNRRRLYWTNIGMKPAGLFGDLESFIQQPKDKKILLKDILLNDIPKKYFLSEKILNYYYKNNEKMKRKNIGYSFNPSDGNRKSTTITTKEGNRMETNFISLDTLNTNAIDIKNKKIRRLTPVECERLQTVPDNYTEGVSDTQRFKMLGNGWTVDVVKHFLEYLPFLRYEEEITSNRTFRT